MHGASVTLERGAHHRVLSTSNANRNASTNSSLITEVATGLNYWNPTLQQWEATEEQFELVNGFALAKKGPHKVILAANINSPGAVDVETAGGKRFVSNPMGLTYYDTKSKESVLFAETKDCVGELVAPNVVIYRDAFNGINGAIRYTYTKSSIEQDIILYEPPPLPGQFGFNATTTLLEVFTEFQNPPSPNKAHRQLAVNLDDDDLDFGEMGIHQGSAFDVEIPTMAIPVGKSWQRIDGRDFLIESIEYPTADRALKARFNRAATTEKNVQSAQIAKRSRSQLVATFSKRAKTTDKAYASIWPGKVDPRAGFVVDYALVNTDQANYTFRGDTTYFISGLVNLTGTANILEGGAILKFESGSSITIGASAALTCKSGPYRPAVLTAKDDDSLGEPVPGSSGTPSGYYATWALRVVPQSSELKYLLIRYAQSAIAYDDYQFTSWGGNHVARHIQMQHCQTGFNMKAADTLYVGNALLHDCATGFAGPSGHAVWVTTDNLTVDACQTLLNTSPSVSGGGFTCRNGVFTAIPTLSIGLRTPNGVNNGFYSTTPFGVPSFTVTASPYAPVAGGLHYLTDSSMFRNAGTPFIDQTTLIELKTKTTYPPETLPASVTANTVLQPSAVRDTELPDLGYHYEPLDYIASGTVVAPGVTLVSTNGTAIGVEYSQNAFGIILNAASFVSQGRPDALNRLVRAHTVQEQSTGNPFTRAILYDNTDIYFDYPPRTCRARFRFTEFDQFNNDGYFLYTGYAFDTLEWYNSRFFNTSLVVEYGGPEALTCGLTNSIWEYGALEFDGYSSLGAMHARNNLFRNTGVHLVGGTAQWSVRDNVFDHGYAADYGSPVPNSYNASYLLDNYLLLAPPNNVILSSLGFEIGPLGEFYLPSTSTSLINQGSRLASDAGLYHYTTQVSQVKEASSTVDIGFHYLATGCNNVDTVWVEDSLPPGAVPFSDGGDSWTWVSSNPSPFSGALAHQSALVSGNPYNHQHGFTGATTTITPGIGERLFAYVNVDPNSPPWEVMLQWYDGSSWGHRAYWGANVITYGTDGTVSRRYMGPLPSLGQWVRLEVPASAVGLEGVTISGMAFTLREGKATWDYAGKRTGAFICDSDGDGLPDYLEDLNGNGVLDSGESNINLVDSDGDGLSDFEEYAFGFDPRSNLNPSTGSYYNYLYDLLDRLINVTGRSSATLLPDKEGNIKQVTP